MLTDKQMEIFTVFVKNPYKKRTRQEIKHLSKEKSNNALNIALDKFKKENLIIEKKVGRSSLFKLNFENNLIYYYIALCNDKRLKKIVKLSLNYVIEEVKKETLFFTIIVFGSYAIGQEKKSSDLDIAIIVEDKYKVKDIEIKLSNATLKSVLNLDIHVIVYEDFLKMLNNNEENLGKQIARKHLVVYNNKIFYDLLNEGIKNGFRF